MKELVKYDQQLVKKANREIILRMIREKKPISRAELAKLVGMSPTSVSRIVAELCDEGIIEESSVQKGGVGRRAILLSTNPQALYALSIQIDQDLARLGIVDLDSSIINSRELSFKDDQVDYRKIVEKLAQLSKEMIEEARIDKKRIVGLGMGIPGITDPERGKVIFSPQLGWKDKDLARDMEALLDLQVSVDNLTKLKALAENRFGSTGSSSKTAYISLGTGVGSALVIDGEIFKGVTNSAGEIGHTTVEPGGRLCECGRRGCLQTYITESALIKAARENKAVDSVAQIIDYAKEKEKWAEDILDKACTYMAVAVSNVICMYNPDRVILGGRLLDENPIIKDRLEEEVENIIWQPFKGSYEMICTSLGKSAGILGGATQVIDQYLYGRP